MCKKQSLIPVLTNKLIGYPVTNCNRDEPWGHDKWNKLVIKKSVSINKVVKFMKTELWLKQMGKRCSMGRHSGKIRVNFQGKLYNDMSMFNTS